MSHKVWVTLKRERIWGPKLGGGFMEATGDGALVSWLCLAPQS